LQLSSLNKTGVAILSAQQDISVADIESVVTNLTAKYVSNFDKKTPLTLQGLDSLSTLELRKALQQATGLELYALVEDLSVASVDSIVQEIANALQSPLKQRKTHQPDTAPVVGSPWIAPAPSFIKMRVFCLPYAGGVSENIFARCAVVQHARRHCSSSI
jgi:acyl carrier protein